MSILRDPGVQTVSMSGRVVWERADANGWQPIETAPRDGAIVVGSWPALDGQMQLPVQWVDGGWHLAWACWGDESDDCEPLHWRPLPPDPV